MVFGFSSVAKIFQLVRGGARQFGFNDLGGKHLWKPRHFRPIGASLTHWTPYISAYDLGFPEHWLQI